MAKSPRLIVLQKLTEHLRGVTPTNGYEADLSKHVYRGRTLYGEETDLPIISIVEAPRPDFQIVAGMNNEATYEKGWPILLQGMAEDDENNPTDPAYELMWQVERRLAEIIATDPNKGTPKFPDAYLLGRSITELAWGPGIVRPPNKDVSARAYFYLPLRIGLAGQVR